MSQPKKLFRNMQNKMIAGVCSGLADYASVDVNIMRLAFVAGIFAGGLSIIVYIVAAMIVPEKPAE